MMEMDLTAFLGWMSVINIGFLTIATISVLLVGSWATQLHAKIFHLDVQSIAKMQYQFLAIYKVVTLVFCLAPYFSLKLMGL